ncbi:MAG: MBOAT family protein [Gemmataceae bacterium]|nr:MBOAT family protein [Gemmataceae bacterium]
MLFNTWLFVLFFLAVFLLYLALPRYRWQNYLLLGASYIFYGVWDWRFAALMFATTLVDWWCGLRIAASSRPRTRKAFLLLSLVSNLTALGFFKYYNFFLESLDGLLAPLGATPTGLHLHIVLPVGISFYTFQSISYTVDVYRGDCPTCHSLLDFTLFVSFFPQLVAGPIERARVLLEQVQRQRTFEEARFLSGLGLLFWGFWKKIVLADNLAALADPLFASSASLHASEAYLAVVAFAFQIYCDFSAYSDIARGLAKLLGFELMRNFAFPYFALNPSDFWRRWHISLSTWLRDYLYIPLGGSRGSTLLTYRNLCLTMLLGGLWHGASWNFVWWGAFHGAILCGHRLLTFRRAGPVMAPVRSYHRGHDCPRSPGFSRLWATGLMFQFTLFGWLLFRCNRRVPTATGSYDDSFTQIVEMLTSFRNGWGLDLAALQLLLSVALLAVPLLLLEWYEHRRGNEEVTFAWPRWMRVGVTAAMVFSWIFWGVADGEAFIYFQF